VESCSSSIVGYSFSKIAAALGDLFSEKQFCIAVSGIGNDQDYIVIEEHKLSKSSFRDLLPI
jgi:hypothetical protein